MEYIQLTLDDYIQCKTEIKENLGGIVKSFVRIGWQLTRINNSQAYKHDGYNTIAEFAKVEYGMNPSGVSRFMSVYERYSDAGDTPELKEQYRNFNFSQLTEMLQLSEEDQEMILPEAGKEDIRELKRFNKENEHNPDNLLHWQQEEDSLENAVLELFRERKETLNALYESEAYRENDIEGMKAIVRREKMTFKKTGIFIIMYNEKLFVKNRVESRCDVEWEDFFKAVRTVFDGAAAGGRTWENYFEPESQNNALEENDSENETYTEEVRVENEQQNKEKTESKEEKSQETALGSSETVPLSAYGTKTKVYPEGSLIATKGCEGGHYCFSCGMRCDIRQENRYCRCAPMGNPFPCLTMNVLESLKQDIGAKCQFINQELAYHREGDGEATPCCMNCNELCGYACRRATEQAAEEAQIPGQKKIEDYPEVIPEPKHFTEVGKEVYGWTWHELVKEYLKTKYKNPEKQATVTSYGETYNVLKREKVTVFYDEAGRTLFDVENERLASEYDWLLEKREIAPAQMNEPEIEENAQDPEETVQEAAGTVQEELEAGERKYNPLFIRDNLETEERNLKEYLDVKGLPLVVVMKQEALVKGMRLLLKEAEDPEEIEEVEEPIQPPLPLMKNNDQRKAWLRTWKDWGLWYQDEHTGVKYYKYDFENGARLIAEVYITPKRGNIPEFESSYLHLVGGPEPPKGTDGIGKWNIHNTYNRYPHSETELVEFLKEIQKNGKDR